MFNKYWQPQITGFENIYAQDAPLTAHQVTDYGHSPFVVDVVTAAAHNENFRTAMWTGQHLQLTVMSIQPGSDVGLEMHPSTDQVLFVAEGSGIARMGASKDSLPFQQPAFPGSAVFVPAGTWHNLVNTGSRPLKLYSVYSPPEHAFGTVHKTKEDADKEEWK